ncbi:6-phosphofructokinase [Reichenbachiella agarivorans]|uniref:6-phosphofructokinase n=1 Tax=Reichenbachiella agarivorans TaxID=2979464 RepID=A0ABY6CJK0_9BACT|nr:6-phosphofructokinase [Reichenbachiella agarivorans]UXP30701.1 6-phosphofructokinase [Reichenbachiella agarivorans]
MSQKSVAIICGGGPAPGINTVVSTVAKIFLKDGYEVLGIHDGYRGLFSPEPKVISFDFHYADRIFSRGGSSILMSRFKPKDSDFNTDFFVKNNVKLLVTIGGDDTASTANRISKYLAKNNLPIANIHVPKTIDNDLPLPDRNPTFGFHSAKDEGVKIGNTIYEDAITSNNWFVMSAMGRTAGHLAFGIASACHFPMLIIPEMFNKTKATLDKVVSLIISSMLKRKLLGINYGVALISEGVFHIIDEEELKASGIMFTYDDHGHPELGNVSKSNIFNILVQERLKSMNLQIKSRPIELGYELRCCRPIGYDLTLCTLLAIGVKKLFDEGISGCIVTTNSRGDITPMFLSEFENSDGVIPPRLVDIDAEISKLSFKNLHFIQEEDYEQLGLITEDPTQYDFNKILNW